ncbi:MAG: four helix bundle protein [Bacteroidales bacterium]|nr:four helix bundle protein [Bacteroidales bacterium]
MTNFNLDERMIDFSVKVIRFTENLPKSNSGIYFSDQIMRSVSSAVLNYSEAQSAESRKDFIHKVKVSLKELRETYSGLRIIEKLSENENENIIGMIKENNELISILVTSIKTARKNMNNSKC